jgi:hypothetical protein
LYESSDGTVADGAGGGLFTGRTAFGVIHRAVLRFALRDSLPADAAIDSVTLEMQVTRQQGGTHRIVLRRALASWGEGPALAPGRGGGGGGAQPGDATWLHRFYPDMLWQTPGGEIAPDTSGSTSVDGVNLTARWDSPAALVSDVQRWVSRLAPEYGWFVTGDESTTSTSVRLASREYLDPALAPRVRVRYHRVTQAPSRVAPEALALRLDRRADYQGSICGDARVPSGESGTLRLLDTAGRLASGTAEQRVDGTQRTFTIPRSAGLAPGVYFVVLTARGQHVSARTVVLH